MKSFKMLDKLIGKYLIITLLLVIVVLNHQFIFSLIGRLFQVASPIIYGAAIAYVLNILVKVLEKHLFPETDHKILINLRRPISIILSIVIILVVLMFILNLVVPQLISVLMELVEVVPAAFETLQQWIINNEELFPPIAAAVENMNINWQAIVQNILNFFNNLSGSLIGTTLSTVYSLFGTIINFVLSLIIAIYILMSKEKLWAQFKKLSETYLSRKYHEDLMYVIDVAHYSFTHFFTGQVFEAMLSGVLVTIGMLIFGFPYATMIGAVTGVTTLIPILGAYLSGAVGILLILPQSLTQAFWFLIFIIFVQQIEGNIIYPKVVGNSIGLPGLWVLSSVTIGGGLAGIWGMILAVPLTSTVYKLVKTDVSRRQKNKKQNEATGPQSLIE